MADLSNSNVKEPYVLPPYQKAYDALKEDSQFSAWREANNNSLVFQGPTRDNRNCTLHYSINRNQFATNPVAETIIVAELFHDGLYNFLVSASPTEES